MTFTTLASRVIRVLLSMFLRWITNVSHTNNCLTHARKCMAKEKITNDLINTIDFERKINTAYC